MPPAKDNAELLRRSLNGAGWLSFNDEQRRIYRRAAAALNMADARAQQAEGCDDGQ